MSELLALQSRMIRTWFEFLKIYLASVATISARMPIIAAAATGSAIHRRSGKPA